jgi:hypothetical protein
MRHALVDALTNAEFKTKPAVKKFSVMQRGVNGEHAIFHTDDRPTADKVAAENPARCVKVNT